MAAKKQSKKGWGGLANYGNVQPPKQAIAPPANWLAPPAPAEPKSADPFFSADDLTAINAFNSDYETALADVKRSLDDLETDTAFQQAGIERSAKQGTASAQDDAAARGIFQSSVKDAVIYDIEAQRSLQAKFLDDKLTTARLDAGTRTHNLNTSKENFDKAMLQKKGENAQGVNDATSSAWADAMAAWKSGPGSKVPTAAPNVSFSPSTTPPKGSAQSTAASSNQAAYNANRTQVRKSAAAAVKRARGRR